MQHLPCCAGTRVFIVHARAAWLKGLSPKENRDIPPLNRELAAQLKADFPDSIFVVNGGIKTLSECQTELGRFDGVMLGREAYNNPWLLTEVDHALYGDPESTLTRDEVVEQMADYVDLVQEREPLAARTAVNHLMGLALGINLITTFFFACFVYFTDGTRAGTSGRPSLETAPHGSGALENEESR